MLLNQIKKSSTKTRKKIYFFAFIFVAKVNSVEQSMWIWMWTIFIQYLSLPSIYPYMYKTECVNAWLLIKWISCHTATAVNDSHTENNKKTEENRISFLSFRSLYGILISNMLKQLVSVKAHIYIKLRDNPILLIWINIRTFFYVPMPIYGECCVLCVR